jgi:hypothetical protein
MPDVSSVLFDCIQVCPDVTGGFGITLLQETARQVFLQRHQSGGPDKVRTCPPGPGAKQTGVLRPAQASHLHCCHAIDILRACVTHATCQNFCD